MSFLKNLFGGGGDSKLKNVDKLFEKYIMKSGITSNSLGKLLAQDLKQIRAYLEGKGNLQIEEAHKQFFLIIGQGKFSLPAKLKILTVIHKYIIELGEYFAQEFLKYNLISLFNQISNKPKPGQTEDWIYQNIVSFYFNYLLRLANNYSIYKICIEEGQLPETEDSKMDYKLKFMWLFKLQNIFSYVSKISENMEHCLKQFPKYLMIQDIALLILHDCVSYYNVVSKEVTDLVQSYHLLTTIDLMQFYSVYTELLQLTKQMSSFFLMKQLFDYQDYILEPKWFRISPQTNREIQIYSKKVELLHVSAANMRRTLKHNDQNLNQQGSHLLNFTEVSETNNPKKNNKKNSSYTLTDSQYNRMDNPLSPLQEDDKHRFEDEELSAIRQYDELLKREKRANNPLYQSDPKNKENDDLHKKKVLTDQSHNTNISSEKPYTFRCTESKQERKHEILKEQIKPNVDVKLNSLSSHESLEIEEQTDAKDDDLKNHQDQLSINCEIALPLGKIDQKTDARNDDLKNRSDQSQINCEIALHQGKIDQETVVRDDDLKNHQDQSQINCEIAIHQGKIDQETVVRDDDLKNRQDQSQIKGKIALNQGKIDQETDVRDEDLKNRQDKSQIKGEMALHQGKIDAKDDNLKNLQDQSQIKCEIALSWGKIDAKDDNLKNNVDQSQINCQMTLPQDTIVQETDARDDDLKSRQDQSQIKCEIALSQDKIDTKDDGLKNRSDGSQINWQITLPQDKIDVSHQDAYHQVQDNQIQENVKDTFEDTQMIVQKSEESDGLEIINSKEIGVNLKLSEENVNMISQDEITSTDLIEIIQENKEQLTQTKDNQCTQQQDINMIKDVDILQEFDNPQEVLSMTKEEKTSPETPLDIIDKKIHQIENMNAECKKNETEDKQIEEINSQDTSEQIQTDNKPEYNEKPEGEEKQIKNQDISKQIQSDNNIEPELRQKSDDQEVQLNKGSTKANQKKNKKGKK